MKTLRLKIVGTRALMMHNARLANPLDPYSIKLKEIMGKKKKTDEDLIAIMRVEARGGAYETEDNKLGLPNMCVYASLFEAAKNFKLGKELKKALRYDESVSPLKVDGKEVDVDKFLSNPNNIDYRAVGVKKSKIMRARPKISGKWESVHEFELDESVMDSRTLNPVIEYGGKNIGLLELRPSLGTYKVEVLNEIKK